MKLTTAALIAALATAPSAILAQTATVTTTSASTPQQTTTQQKAAQPAKRIANRSAIPTKSAVLGSTLTSYDLESLPMGGRNVLDLVGGR